MQIAGSHSSPVWHFEAMDGSRRPPVATTSATRMVLTVDREAVGLMKHAAQMGHLVEWWLQGAAVSMDSLAAFRIGQRLERFRLAARLAEGRASRQVQASLDGLRAELSRHSLPDELHGELQAAYRESDRLKTATLRSAALQEGEPTQLTDDADAKQVPPQWRIVWLVLLLAGLAVAGFLAYRRL